MKKLVINLNQESLYQLSDLAGDRGHATIADLVAESIALLRAVHNHQKKGNDRLLMDNVQGDLIQLGVKNPYV